MGPLFKDSSDWLGPAGDQTHDPWLSVSNMEGCHGNGICGIFGGLFLLTRGPWWPLIAHLGEYWVKFLKLIVFISAIFKAGALFVSKQNRPWSGSPTDLMNLWKTFFKSGQWFCRRQYIRELAPSPEGHVFLDIIMNFKNLHKSHLKIIYDKYHSNLASGFREEDF